MGLSLILSMPGGTSPGAVRESARAFAAEVFGDRFDYVFVLHTDAPHPHVHIAVSALGRGGERLGPKKSDLDLWRQVFAQALRDRGVAAEATPRRARGVIRKAERTPLRKLRERRAARGGDLPVTLKDALRDAASGALGRSAETPWARAIAHRQARIRAAYLVQAQRHRASPDATDRQLGLEVEQFVRGMPATETRREALIRALRQTQSRARAASRGRDRDR